MTADNDSLVFCRLVLKGGFPLRNVGTHRSSATIMYVGTDSQVFRRWSFQAAEAPDWHKKSSPSEKGLFRGEFFLQNVR